MAHLSINVLGSAQVSLAGKPVTTFESLKVRALLIYLAVEADRPHRRETLLGLLWPDYPQESARHSLRQALFNLRSSIGDQTAQPPYLIISRDAIQFNRESDYSLDLASFNQHHRACKEALGKEIQDSSACPEGMQEMAKLYRGEFLQGFFLEDSDRFEDWALVQRESLRQQVIDVLTYLAGYHELHGDYQAARGYASRQLELDPWREEAYRQLMRVLALDGQRSAALAQYEACKRILAEELDVEPSAETRKLYEEIRFGTLEVKTGQPSYDSSSPVHNLPVQLTPFVGREAELAQLAQLVLDPQCRCITLLGPGGIGKTRLAVQAARHHAHEFPQGVAFIPLASVGSFEVIIPAITNAIDFSLFGSSAPQVQLLNYLKGKQMLLILDNLEHLIKDEQLHEHISDLVVSILQGAPGIKLLITSRQALNLQGEWVFEVPGLTFPELGQAVDLSGFDAVALFVQRARRVQAGFALNEKNEAQIARICRLVGGMPLAIELAATWMRVLSPAEIVEEIESSLDFLSTAARDMPERHRSMRAVFDQSWQMLSSEEQQVLCKLSVFRGGFQRQAAEEVAGTTLSILSTLINRTLLRRTAEGRYDIHELVRQYSASQLATDPQAQAGVQARHYDYFLNLAETARQGLRGADQLEWLNTLDQEHDNLRAALDWAFTNREILPDGDQLALKLTGALRWFWRMRGHFHEGRDLSLNALFQSSGKHTTARAGALLGLSLLVNSLGDMSMASTLAQESAAIYKELDDQRGLAEALSLWGFLLRWQGESDQSHAHLKEALAIFRKVDDCWGEAQALYRLGSFSVDFSGDPAGRAMLEVSASILEGLEEKYLFTSVLIALGIVHLGSGNYTAAREHFEHSLAFGRELNHPLGTADALTNLGCVARIQGDYAAAQACFEESLQIYQEHGSNIWETDVLCALAENDISQGAFPAARAHLQATSDLLESSENKWLQVLVSHFRGLLAYYEGDIQRAVSLLAETTDLAQEGQYQPDLARSLVALGRARHALGELELADSLIRKGLGLFERLGHRLGIATALEALAWVSVAQEDSPQAVTLFATAQGLREVIGAPLPPVDRPAYESALAACRARLGEAAFTDLWARSLKS